MSFLLSFFSSPKQLLSAHYNNSHTCVPWFFLLFFSLSSILSSTLAQINNSNNNNGYFIIGMVKDEFLRYKYQDNQIYSGALWWSIWLNNLGGLTHDGITQNVTIVTIDASSADPSKVFSRVASAYETLVTEYNVSLIISPASTERTLAAVSVSEKYKLINFVVGGLSEYFGNYSYVFSLNIPAAQMPIPALSTLTGKQAKDYTIFARPDIVARKVASSAINFMNGISMTMKDYVEVNFTSNDSQNIQNSLREIFALYLKIPSPPDVIVFCALPSELSSVLLSFNEVQPKVKAAIFSVPVSPFEQELNSLGQIGDYWIGTTRFYDSFQFGNPGELGGTTKDFLNSFVKIIGRHPASLDPIIAAALMSYMNAVNLSQTTDSDVVSYTLRTMGRIETFALPIWYADNGVNMEMYEVAIQNRKGVGQYVDENSLVYPADWPWVQNNSPPPSKEDFVPLVLKIVLPVVMFCVLVTAAGLLIARYLNRQAVLALTEAEEGERRNYRLDFKLLTIGDLIGTGSFGNVFRGEYRGADVCIKKLKMQKFSKQQKQKFAQEASIMVGMRHPNIVLFMGVCLTAPNYCIVTEFMHRGSLFDVIHNEKIKLPLSLIMNMLADILKGLYYIHSAGIIHRDLKSPNLLVDRNWTIKIADFGLSCTKSEAATDTQISLLWSAPEVLLNEKGCFSEKSDVYSFGIIVWEIISRKIPFEGMPVAAISPAVVAFQRPPISLDWHPGISSLIVSCWHSKAEDRPTVKEARANLDLMNDALQPQDVHESVVANLKNNENIITGAPASGTVFFVCTTVQHLIQPWNDDPLGTANGIRMINKMLRQTIQLFGGKEVKTDGQSFLFAFSNFNNALGFSIRVQSAALALEWSDAILKFEETCEYRNKSHDVLYRGISLRIGIHHLDNATAERDLGTETVNYFGEGLNTVSKIASAAGRGEILMNADTFAKLCQPPTNIDTFYVEPLGPRRLDDKKPDEYINVCVAIPWALKGRMFIAQPYYEAPIHTTELTKISKVTPNNSSSYLLSASHTATAAYLSTNTLSNLTRTSLLLFTSGTTAAAAKGVDKEIFLFPHSNMNPWVIDLSELSLGSILDTSKNWEVFASTLRGNKPVIVQRFLNQKMSDSQLLDLRAETATLQQLRHENVGRYFGICLASQNMCLVFEQTVCSLSSVLQNPDNSELPWTKKFGWAVDIAKGMFFLHSNGIFHTDLKSPNVAFTSEGTLKIIDYGFHRIKTDTQAMTQAGTVCWVAPEIFLGQSENELSDVYSYGIILWELIFQASPWAGQHTMNVVYKVTHGKRPSISHMPANTPKSISNFMEQCWQQKAADRPFFVDIIAELDPKVLSDV